MSKWIKESRKERKDCSWKREFVTSSFLQTLSHSVREKEDTKWTIVLPYQGIHCNRPVHFNSE